MNMEISDENSRIGDTYQGAPNYAYFSFDDPGTSQDGNQVNGAYESSWGGNFYHSPVITNEVFNAQNGGIGPDKFMALTESKLTILLTEHIFANISEQVRVTRSAQHSQAMDYKYTVQFVHEDVRGEVPSLVHVLGVSLLGRNSFVQISTKVEEASIQGTFKLRFN